MKLGFISDTHGKLRPEVKDVFRSVHQIIHCGDVGSTAILDQLEEIAPVMAAYGNTDSLAVRMRCSRVAKAAFGGLITVATHGDQLRDPTPQALAGMFTDADIIAYGHTHKPFVGTMGSGVTVLNPGAAGRGRGGSGPSVAIVKLDPGKPPEVEIVPLGSSS